MPSTYIQKVIHDNDSFETIIQTIFEKCGTSLLATVFKAVPYLEPGYVVIVEFNGQGVLWQRSSGTDINPRGINISLLTKASTENGRFDIQNYTVNWWKFEYSEQDVFQDVPEEKSTDMIKRILIDVEANPEKRKKYLYSINGVCGSANNNSSTEQEYFTRLKQKFIYYKEKLGAVMDHPDFDRFLQKKAIEVIAKKKNR